MKLRLENIGKIAKANIEINGITVIAGENNTGKSTVGKMLYCIFNSFYKIEEQIYEERKRAITRVIYNYYHEATNRYTRRFDADNFAASIVEHKDNYFNDNRTIKKELKNFYLQADENFEKYISPEFLDIVSNKISSYMDVTDDEIRKTILRKRLIAEFKMKIGHVNYKNSISHITLNIKDNKIDFEILNNEEIKINNFISLIKELVYMDDPFVLDDLNRNHLFRYYDELDHRSHLLEKISESSKNRNGFSALEEITVNKKLEKIMNTLNDVCDGDLSSNEDNGYYSYKTSKLNEALDISNLSTGMKNFVILRTLLQNGSINENGIIVLDEPEIHLHPEWQLKFAEIIVLIQKEFGTNILLNTHSPYFLNAIEAYSLRHQISEKCKYYMTEEKEKRTNIIDVTDNIEKVYEKLAKPLQILESLVYKDGNFR